MYLKWSHPILWPWEASDLLLAQRLVQEEDELPTFVNIHPECAAFFANRSALFMRVFAQKKRPSCHKNHYRSGPYFLFSAIMSQSKFKPNQKLVLSQIQLTDSLPLCFFEKPLMLAGGFCTRSDGNE